MTTRSSGGRTIVQVGGKETDDNAGCSFWSFLCPTALLLQPPGRTVECFHLCTLELFKILPIYILLASVREGCPLQYPVCRT